MAIGLWGQGARIYSHGQTYFCGFVCFYLFTSSRSASANPSRLKVMWVTSHSYAQLRSEVHWGVLWVCIAYLCPSKTQVRSLRQTERGFNRNRAIDLGRWFRGRQASTTPLGEPRSGRGIAIRRTRSTAKRKKKKKQHRPLECCEAERVPRSGKLECIEALGWELRRSS